jgi:hypothetical protein
MSYSSLTDILNSRLINSETEQRWVNIPGGLDKISETSNAAWGLSSGKLYVCALPCSGQWIEQLDIVKDFTTDDSLVYVLTSGLQTKNGNGSGEWTSPITIPSITQIFNTGSYLWGQDSGGKKYKLAKPGTTANWISVPDTSDIKIHFDIKEFKTYEKNYKEWFHYIKQKCIELDKPFITIDYDELMVIQNDNDRLQHILSKLKLIINDELTINKEFNYMTKQDNSEKYEDKIENYEEVKDFISNKDNFINDIV